VRGLFCNINKAVSYVVGRNSGRRIVIRRRDLFLPGGAELQDSGGIDVQRAIENISQGIGAYEII
jgi:hypothetical protein